MFTAQAEDGRKVILYEAGRWEYVQESAPDISSIQEYDFRKVYWGASKEQVKASETESATLEESEYLEYKEIIAGMEARIAYNFKSDHLVGAVIKFEVDKLGNRNSYLAKFESIRSVLMKKYGKPADKILWRDTHYKNSLADHGLALTKGHMCVYCNWEKGTMDILLVIDGKNEVVDFVIEYNGERPFYLPDNSQEEERIMERL